MRRPLAALALAATWTRAFGELGALRVKNAPVRVIELPFDPAAIEAAVKRDGLDVLVATEGLDADLDAITRVALAHRLLTVGATRTFVERGLVLGTFIEDEKPKIFVNMTAARQGAFRFSSAMLRLAVILK